MLRDSDSVETTFNCILVEETGCPLSLNDVCSSKRNHKVLFRSVILPKQASVVKWRCTIMLRPRGR